MRTSLTVAREAAGLHRVFDCLEVPSRFVGTESYVNPKTFVGSRHGLSFGLTAPFDTISNYRYPGKININTVLDQKVWQGLMQSYATDPSDRRVRWTTTTGIDRETVPSVPVLNLPIPIDLQLAANRSRMRRWL